MIVEVLKHYWPEWDAPEPESGRWVKCLCPKHADSVPSCAVHFDFDAVNCLGCDLKGNYITIIKQQEGVNYPDAITIAEAIADATGATVPQQPTKYRSRTMAARPRFNTSTDRSVPTGGGFIPFGGTRKV